MLACLILGLGVAAAQAQQEPAPPSSSKPQQAPPPEAGGPQGDTGPIALPKKTVEPPAPPPSKPKTPEGMPSYTLKVDVPLVTVPVSVTTKDGLFVPGLKKDNFKVFEDGVPQQITTFTQTEAPITAVLLVEFANSNYQFMYDALVASYNFANSLKKDDWIAVIEFDFHTTLLTDFTQDKQVIYQALNTLRVPGFREVNTTDALYDTLDRLSRIDGHKYVVLVGSGLNTFPKVNLDKMLKKIKETKDVTIFTISTGKALRNWVEGSGGMWGGIRDLNFAQADNEMRTFASLTGGHWFQPTFEAEYPEIFRSIAQEIRNEYLVAYHPTNPKLDGTYRKLKVELVAADGGPLKVRDQKGKDLKVSVVSREGYTAKHEVE